jgi:hypothetical protein
MVVALKKREEAQVIEEVEVLQVQVKEEMQKNLVIGL